MTDAVEGAAIASDIAPAAVSDAGSFEPATDRPQRDAKVKPTLVTPARKRGPVAAVAAAVWDGARTIAFALLLSFAIRVVIVEPFHIPSESMEPTLRPGDYIGATKYAYGWSRVSTTPIPLPMLPGRLLGRQAKRGDLVVFRNQLDGGADYVKRIVGLPGDRVQMRDGVLYLNGEAAGMELVETYDGVDPNGFPVRVRVYDETLPGGRCTHQIQHFDYANGRQEGQDDTYEFQVPAEHYFMMGDNRDASYDSRLPGRVGYVPAEEIVGRVEFVLMSVNEGADLPEGSSGLTLRLDRMLKPLICT